MGWHDADEHAHNETNRQTLGDFDLALKPASDWLISFCLSADRDKSNSICIDHLTMIIRCDANGWVLARDKDFDRTIVSCFKRALFFVYSFFFSPSFYHLSVVFSSLSFLSHCEYFYFLLLSFTIDSPTLTNLISDWHSSKYK